MRWIFEEFELDEVAGELRARGEPVELEPTPLSLLLYLLRHRNRTVPKEELLDTLWPGTAVSDAALSSALREVRKALRDDGSQQRLIRTLRRRGYRFVGEVEEQTALATPERPAGTVPFVGRQQLLDQLGTALGRSVAGEGRIVLLAGEPGIGKTRLALEFADRVRNRVLVVEGRCTEHEGAPPFWPWLPVLRTLVREADPKALERDLGPAAADLAQLVPELAEALPVAPRPSETDPDFARFRLFDAIGRLMRGVAAREALVVVFDDLHWADVSSLRLLDFLTPELENSRILLIGTYRDAELEAGHPLAEALATLARYEGCEVAQLEGLGIEEIRELTRELAGSEAPAVIVEAIQKKTDGNPFFVREMVRLLTTGAGDWRADGDDEGLPIPPAIREVVRGRLGRLSEACNEALAIAAVLGRDADPGLIQEVGGLERGLLEPELDEACRRGLLVTTAEGALRFAHAIIQETIYAELSAPSRARLHLELAQALERWHGNDAGPHSAELAHHYARAGTKDGSDKALRHAVAAGERAMQLLAFEQGVAHFDGALQALGEGSGVDSQRCDLLLARSNAERRSGEHQKARETALQARQVAQRLSDANRLARAAEAFADSPILGSFDPRTVELVEEALGALGSEHSTRRARLLVIQGTHLSNGGDPERGEELVAEALSEARRLREPATLTHVLLYRNRVLMPAIHPRERLAACGEALELANAAGDQPSACQAQIQRLRTLLAVGDHAAADAEAEALEQRVALHRIPFERNILKGYSALRAYLRGRFDEAERLAREAVLEGRRMDPYRSGPRLFAAFLTFLRRDQGRLGEMEPFLVGFVRDRQQSEGWGSGLALFHAELGREAEAREAFEGCAEVGFGNLQSGVLALACLAEACVFLDDKERAETLYGMLRPLRDRHVTLDAYVSLGSVARFLGSLGTTLERWNDAEQHFEKALESHARIESPPLLARTRYEYARLLVARGGPGDREKAIELVGSVLAVAEELGMKSLAERAGALRSTAAGVPSISRGRRSRA